MFEVQVLVHVMMSGFPTVHDSSLMDALGLVSADVPSTNHIRELSFTVNYKIINMCKILNHQKTKKKNQYNIYSTCMYQ